MGSWVADLVQGPVRGIQFAHVEVDTETGRVRPLKIVCVQDAGVVMNKTGMQSQMNGGVIQGLGFALTEEVVLDAQTGQMLNPNLEEYKLPGPWEMPVIESIVHEYPEAKGVSGMAESVIIPTASAVANAVYNAIGARVRSLPLLPARVLDALGKVPGGAVSRGGTLS
jgi:xanthine dehydrogenase YagR molybdenum-binding subunit